MPQIRTRQLGKGGPLVPRIGFGTMGLSYSYGTPLPDEQRLAVLDHAYKIGETFWDTSDAYRPNIFLATKLGGIYISQNERSFRGDAEYVHEAYDKSLKRLGVDYIDLYYPHRLDGSTPIKYVGAEMVKLKEQGKIRYIGLCEVSAGTLRRAHAVHPITAIQIEYSPFTTVIEDPKIGLLETCRELGVAVVAYSPLSRGLLSGRVKTQADFEASDVRKFFPRSLEENFAKNMEIVKELQGIAAEKSCTAGQTSKIEYLEENFWAANVDLAPEELARIRSLVDNAASGAKWPDAMAIYLFADTPLPHAGPKESSS
ncbi:NADP-dependent oxidoreductase domain-containing protein [Xylariales sp. AK1849]|nr:NADP-dependent oxidoreductase domain-containing protein [Xylariales sp. AK1849]